MSGGYFDYQEYKLVNIADSIEEIIATNGKPNIDEWGHNHNTEFNEEQINVLKSCRDMLLYCYAIVKSLDFGLSGDTDPSRFPELLQHRLEWDKNTQDMYYKILELSKEGKL